MHRWLCQLLYLLVGAVITADVSAHAMLESAEPGAGARLEKPPTSVVLHFDSMLEAVFCGITVKSITDDRTITGPVQSADRERASLRLALPTLPSGEYRVTWQAVARDGHRTSGDYTFTIK